MCLGDWSSDGSTLPRTLQIGLPLKRISQQELKTSKSSGENKPGTVVDDKELETSKSSGENKPGTVVDDKAMAIWRAKKLESLQQRMQRSAGVLQQTGFGEACSCALDDPSGYECCSPTAAQEELKTSKSSGENKPGTVVDDKELETSKSSGENKPGTVVDDKADLRTHRLQHKGVVVKNTFIEAAHEDAIDYSLRFQSEPAGMGGQQLPPGGLTGLLEVCLQELKTSKSSGENKPGTVVDDKGMLVQRQVSDISVSGGRMEACWRRCTMKSLAADSRVVVHGRVRNTFLEFSAKEFSAQEPGAKSGTIKKSQSADSVAAPIAHDGFIPCEVSDMAASHQFKEMGPCPRDVPRCCCGKEDQQHHRSQNQNQYQNQQLQQPEHYDCGHEDQQHHRNQNQNQYQNQQLQQPEHYDRDHEEHPAVPIAFQLGSDCCAASGADSSEPSFVTDSSEQVEQSAPATVMLRNIACSYTQKDIAAILDAAGFRNGYDWIYTPRCKQARKASNIGYAFVNFTTLDYVQQCREVFDGQSFGPAKSKKMCQVDFANTQGKVYGPKKKRSRALCMRRSL